MVQPISRLHALELIMEVMIADRAAQYQDGENWLKDRMKMILVRLADCETQVLSEVGSSDGLAEMHTVVGNVFGEAARILEGFRPKPDVQDTGGN